jgi:hypothetical protein
MYAMVLGHLPFSTPYKDEYQRQRMLQSIQKGLSGYHDREMQILSKGCPLSMSLLLCLDHLFPA